MIRRDHGRAALLARPSILPAFWQDALDGLRSDGWPPGEEVPLDLGEIVRAAEARVTVPRGWDALLASSRREPLVVTATRWQRSPERVRQLAGRAWLFRQGTEGDSARVIALHMLSTSLSNFLRL